MKLTPGVNFTNIFTHSFYARRSQRCKKTVKSSVSSCAFGMFTARKMWVKSTPGVNIINMLMGSFYRCKYSCSLLISFTIWPTFMIYAIHCEALRSRKYIGSKATRKTMIKLTPVINFINFYKQLFRQFLGAKKLESQIVIWEKLLKDTFMKNICV